MRVKGKRVGGAAGIGFSQKEKLYTGLNGTSTAGTGYGIGFAYSLDRSTWVTYGGALLQKSVSGWDSSTVKDAGLIWDGTQYVCYYGGYDGTTYQIGRAVSQHPSGPWIKYASNPVVAKGTTGDPDQLGCEFPVVHFDGTTYRMWYQGYPSGWNISTNPIGTVCFADSTDGITWTKHGTVIARGAGGSFNEINSQPGCVYKSGSTWYVYFGGFRATDFFSRSAYATCTTPSSSASYSAVAQLSNYTGNITVGGKTWQSNLPRGILLNTDNSTYTPYLSLWKPTDTTTILESACQVTSADLTSWTTPSALMFPFESWDSVSAENPSLLVAP